MFVLQQARLANRAAGVISGIGKGVIGEPPRLFR